MPGPNNRHNSCPLFLSVRINYQHVKLKYNLYFFEVQNLAEALSGQRPKLVQLGPYAYDEYYVKFDISWTDDGDTVSCNTQRYYLFNPEETGAGLSQEDQITLPYACVVGFEYLLSGMNVTQSELLDAALEVGLNTSGFYLSLRCYGLCGVFCVPCGVWGVRVCRVPSASPRLSARHDCVLEDSWSLPSFCCAVEQRQPSDHLIPC